MFMSLSSMLNLIYENNVLLISLQSVKFTIN